MDAEPRGVLHLQPFFGCEITQKHRQAQALGGVLCCQPDKLEFVHLFFILPTTHLINKIAPAIAATFNNETATVVTISGAICSEGIVAYISRRCLFSPT